MTMSKKQKATADYKNAMLKLSGLENFPMQPGGQQALADAFQEHVQPALLDEAIKYFLDDKSSRCPSPWEVKNASYENLWSMEPADRLRALSARQEYCKRCENTGWQPVTKGNLRGVMPCTCPMGQRRVDAYGKAVANNRAIGRGGAIAEA